MSNTIWKNSKNVIPIFLKTNDTILAYLHQKGKIVGKKKLIQTPKH